MLRQTPSQTLTQSALPLQDWPGVVLPWNNRDCPPESFSRTLRPRQLCSLVVFSDTAESAGTSHRDCHRMAVESIGAIDYLNLFMALHPNRDPMFGLSKLRKPFLIGMSYVKVIQRPYKHTNQNETCATMPADKMGRMTFLARTLCLIYLNSFSRVKMYIKVPQSAHVLAHSREK